VALVWRDGTTMGMNTERGASFKVLLRRYRLEAGLTQEALAARAGVSARNIQELERGANNPLRDTARRLVNALDLTADDRRRFDAAAPPGPRRRDRAATHLVVGRGRLSADGLAALPQPPTPFIGRAREIVLVREALRDRARLLTLTGVGGVGKTRLALRVADEVRADFADGAFFVDLTATRDPGLAPALIARAFGLREAAGRTPEELLIAALCERRLLLVLDNCEHVLTAMGVVSALLAAAPGVTVLATSRVALHLYGEHEVRVPPLETPDPSTARAARPDALRDYPAVQLFLQRARAARADLTPTPEVVRAVATLCARLDGLPLAIELAAARCKLYAPATLLARLDDRLALLTDGPYNLPTRQQTLRNTLDWSYALLGAEERRLFARAAVFDGGWDLEAAEAACASGLEASVRGGLEGLADHNLIEATDDGATGPRFRMLETVREYAIARLAESMEAEEMGRRHAQYYLALAERAEPELTGRKQVLWLDRLETELNNLRAALTWARDSGDVEVGLRLAGALYRFWDHHSHFAEGRKWLEAGLARGAGLPADVRVKALHVAGVLTLEQGAYDQAAAYLSDSLALFRGLGNLYGAAFALYALGTIALYRGEHERATAFLTEALKLLREVRDTDGIAALLGQIGYAALLRRDYERAIARFEESLALYQDMGSTLGSGNMLTRLGRALLEQGDHARAWTALTEGLRLTRQAGNWWYIAECLETMAAATAAGGEPMRAARLWGATEALRASLAAPLPPVEQPLYERHIAAARALSDDASFTAAWAEGRALTLERTLALATATATAPNPAMVNGL